MLERQCVVCMAAAVDTLILECGHLALCHTCARDPACSKTCPLCRSKVKRTVRAYYS
jgi:hypothetical protein